MSQSAMTWVVVADAQGARIFSYAFKTKPWKLMHEVKGTGLDAPPEAEHGGQRASEHQGALKGHAAGSTPKEKQERSFAHELIHVLERGMADNEFGHLALIAAPKLLGELREGLGRGLAQKVVAEIHKDYTHLNAKDLQAQVFEALPEVV